MSATTPGPGATGGQVTATLSSDAPWQSPDICTFTLDGGDQQRQGVDSRGPTQVSWSTSLGTHTVAVSCDSGFSDTKQVTVAGISMTYPDVVGDTVRTTVRTIDFPDSCTGKLDAAQTVQHTLAATDQQDFVWTGVSAGHHNLTMDCASGASFVYGVSVGSVTQATASASGGVVTETITHNGPDSCTGTLDGSQPQAVQYGGPGVTQLSWANVAPGTHTVALTCDSGYAVSQSVTTGNTSATVGVLGNVVTAVMQTSGAPDRCTATLDGVQTQILTLSANDTQPFRWSGVTDGAHTVAVACDGGYTVSQPVTVGGTSAVVGVSGTTVTADVHADVTDSCDATLDGNRPEHLDLAAGDTLGFAWPGASAGPHLVEITCASGYHAQQSVSVTVSADLGVSVNVANPGPNFPAAFTLVVTNDGPDASTGTVLTVPPIAGDVAVRQVGTSVANCSAAPDETFTCQLGDVARQGVKKVDVVLQTGSDDDLSLTLAASVAGDLPDPVGANNSSSATAVTATCQGTRPTIVGTTGADQIVGTPERDVIVTGLGDDNIQGLGGDDLICAGAGADTVDGGVGNDVVDSGAGDDTLSGSQGNDVLSGCGGADSLIGGSEDDGLYPGAGDDRISGGSGHDQLRYDQWCYEYVAHPSVDVDLGRRSVTGRLGTDTLTDRIQDVYGTPGPDELTGGTGTHLYGLGGADRLHGPTGRSVLDGGADDDRLYGGAGSDTLRGGGDDDTLYPTLGDDVQGNDGQDTVDFSGFGNAVKAELDQGRYSVGVLDATVSTVENVVGTRYDDTIYGSAAANNLSGGAGNDLISGLGGHDTLVGEGGNDRLQPGGGGADTDGGAGDDILDFSAQVNSWGVKVVYDAQKVVGTAHCLPPNDRSSWDDCVKDADSAGVNTFRNLETVYGTRRADTIKWWTRGSTGNVDGFDGADDIDVVDDDYSDNVTGGPGRDHCSFDARSSFLTTKSDNIKDCEYEWPHDPLGRAAP